MFPQLLLLVLFISWALLAGPPPAQAFSSSAGTCFEPLIAFHGSASSGPGGFTIETQKDGAPVSEVLPGETVQITITRAAGYKGFLAKANEGDEGGALVAGFSVNSADHQLESACTTPGSAMTHVFDPSPNPLPRTGESLSWTAPEMLTPGTQIAFTVYGVVSITEWYGQNESIQTVLSVAAPPAVPSLEAWGLVLVAVLAMAVTVARVRRA